MAKTVWLMSRLSSPPGRVKSASPSKSGTGGNSLAFCVKILKCESCPRMLAVPAPSPPPVTSMLSVSSTLSRTMSRNLSAGSSASPACSICTWLSV